MQLRPIASCPIPTNRRLCLGYQLQAEFSVEIQRSLQHVCTHVLHTIPLNSVINCLSRYDQRSNHSNDGKIHAVRFWKWEQINIFLWTWTFNANRHRQIELNLYLYAFTAGPFVKSGHESKIVSLISMISFRPRPHSSWCIWASICQTDFNDALFARSPFFCMSDCKFHSIEKKVKKYFINLFSSSKE